MPRFNPTPHDFADRQITSTRELVSPVITTLPIPRRQQTSLFGQAWRQAAEMIVVGYWKEERFSPYATANYQVGDAHDPDADVNGLAMLTGSFHSSIGPRPWLDPSRKSHGGIHVRVSGSALSENL